MKRKNTAIAIALTALFTASVANADGFLRIKCFDDSEGADIFINDKEVGTCPVDAPAPAGIVTVRARKQVGSEYEKVFVKEVRVIDNVPLRMEITLSAPQLTAAKEAQRHLQSAESGDVDAMNKIAQYYATGYGVDKNEDKARQWRDKAQLLAPVREDAQWKLSLETATQAAMQAYLEKYPQGRYAKQAREKEKVYGLRSIIPFKLSEDVWRALELSEDYNNLPIVPPVTFDFDSNNESDSGRFFVPNLKYSSSTTIKKMSLDSHYYMKELNLHEYGIFTSYHCGLLQLGSFYVQGDVKVNFIITNIDYLNGSIFPLRIGNKMSYRIHNETDDKSSTKSHNINEFSYEVVEKRPASELDSRLTGTAWKLHTVKNIIGEISKSEDGDDYYLEDLGVIISDYGIYSQDKKSWIFPKLGYKYKSSEYGQTTTTIYTRYDWKVGK